MSKPILPAGPTPSTTPIAANGPRDVIVKAGQSLVLHDGSKVLVNVKATKDVRYFTAWKSIVGTEAEVASQVAALNLK